MRQGKAPFFLLRFPRLIKKKMNAPENQTCSFKRVIKKQLGVFLQTVMSDADKTISKHLDIIDNEIADAVHIAFDC